MTAFASLLPPSKGALLRLLLRGGASASLLASRSRLHPSVVRRHMNDLVHSGLVEATPVSARRGRPSVCYGLTPAGRELFYTRYDTVLESVARVLRSTRGSRSARKVFRDAGRTLANKLGGQRRSSEVVSLFQAIGFEPELTHHGGQRVILSHNCPILEVAKVHPELTCDAFHCTLLGELLGTSPPPLRQAISRGAPYCVHELDRPN